MKNYVLPFTLLIGIVLSAGAAGAALLVTSKHNLSSSGTGSYKADSNNPAQGGTTELCIFCHTPHSGNTEAPLWNRTSSVATYQTYTSDVLAGLGYPGAEDPKNGVPHSKTRICLSCHDGTIALGSVVNMPNDIPTSYTQILMSGNSKIQPNAVGYIGIDLRDDHPVSIKHDRTNDPELKSGALVGGIGVRLYKAIGGKSVVDYADGNYVECTSCHNPHDNANTKFLIAPNAGSGICLSCHTKRTGPGQQTPAHDAAVGVGYNPDGAGTIGTTVGAVKCMNCHYSHKAGVDPANPTQPIAANGMYLLSFEAEGTCFNNTNRWGQITSACHGNNGAPSRNIEAELSVGLGKAHKYPAGLGKHRALEAGSYGWLGVGNPNWHVDCSDCHNSHTAGSTNHTAGIGPAGNAILGTLVNTSPLYGAGGVSISWSGSWPTVPGQASFTAFESLGLTNSSSMPANYYEYQICMKCHSSFAWGAGTPPNSPSLSVAMTDQAKEFNPGNVFGVNASMHPVAGATGNLTWGTLNAPWGVNRGNQTMYCSDCHNTNGVNAQGPHGSSNAAILPMTYNNTYGAKGTYQSSGLGASDDLCFKCHSETVYQSGAFNLAGTGFYSSANGINLHTQHRIHSLGSATSTFGYRCVNCHTRVPHGYGRKAMIVLQGEGFPYEARNLPLPNQGKITSVNLPASNLYAATLPNKNVNCSTVAGCH